MPNVRRRLQTFSARIRQLDVESHVLTALYFTVDRDIQQQRKRVMEYMKDATIRIEFVSPCLASGVPGTDKNNFNRDQAGNIVLNAAGVFSAICKAVEVTKHPELRAKDVHLGLTLDAPTALYVHRLGAVERTHEGVLAGTIVNLSAVVPDFVTEAELTELMSNLGRFFGISPFGHKIGYGRFNVHSVTFAS